MYKSSGTAARPPRPGQEEVRLRAADIRAIDVERLPEPPANDAAPDGEVRPVGYEEPAEAGEPYHSVVIFADPTLLPNDAECVVETFEDGKATTYSGRVAAAGADGLTLAEARQERHEEPAPPTLGEKIASKLPPYLGRRLVSSAVAIDEPLDAGTEVRVAVEEIGSVWVTPPTPAENRSVTPGE